MTQIDSIRQLIAALDSEIRPDSIPPERMAGILHAMLEALADSKVEIDSNMRQMIIDKIEEIAYTADPKVPVLYLTAEQAKSIVDDVFGDVGLFFKY